MRSLARYQAAPPRYSAAALGTETAARRAGRVRRGPVTIRLWIPLSPLLVLATPLVMVAASIAALHPRLRRLRPIRLAWGLGAVLASLSGTLVDVRAPRATITIRLI